MLSRTSFRFSPGGQYAACLATADSGRVTVERWTLDPAGAPEPLPFTPTGLQAQVLPLDDGRVLLCQPVDGGHEIRDSEGLLLHRLTAPGVRLVEHPGRHAVAISTTGAPESTLWLVDDAELTPIATVPGILGGGGWLRPDVLALNQAVGGTVRAVAIDFATGTAELLWPDRPTLRLLLAISAELFVVGERPDRIGLLRPGCAPQWLDGLTGSLPLAADPSGRLVVFRTNRGSRAGLSTADVDTLSVDELPVPQGTVGGVASWTAAGLRFPFAGPDHAAGIAEMTPEFRMVQGGETAGPRPYARELAHVDTVCYGDIERAESVLLALHGGPDAAWQLDSVALLRRFAEAGLGVVAVNPRGSRGYGGAIPWGGPDLADVVAVAREIGRPVRLFGASYGAFLALLAVALHPERFERAAVVAPFLSGPRLYADGGTRVRALLDRLGGKEIHADERGPRDLAVIADRIRTPLLLMHGAADTVIPVAHSRELAGLIPTATYVEVPGAGHDLLTEPDPAQRLIGFLTDIAGHSAGEQKHDQERR